MKKVFVIGLDCAPPSIVFDRRKELPNINRLIDESLWGIQKTCEPPITIPAWMVMSTSKTPGDLGIYGFRQRKDNSYKDIELSFSHVVNTPAIWDIIGKRGMQSCLVGVPPTYPPKEINGNLISCFMTPDADRDYTHPKSLKQEIESRFGKYIFDVAFRVEDRDKLLKALYDMTKKRFDIISYLIQNKPWRYFMFVEIGVDRAHHAFWKYHDKTHRGYIAGHKYETVIMDYYKFIDKNIGGLLKLLDDDTVVIVVSDHGAKAMKGAFCINQWLIEKGYLALRDKPKPGTGLEKADVDWLKTTAWGWGGYEARIFLNIKDRETTGIIPRLKYSTWIKKLKREIKQIKGPKGEEWDTKVYEPNELYETIKGKPADLVVYFDNMCWRSAGTIGYSSVYLSENDKGPDDTVHDWDSVFIMHDPEKKRSCNIKNISIYDFAPTVLDILGVDVPKDMRGRSLLK